ncbi:MAG: L,D-transpeptidase [Acidobacteria bacterium]|nr:L,D-transpeptidase [Acidobacteriota bacterium]
MAEQELHKLGRLLVVLLAAATEASAEAHARPRRRIVVSIPDRKLAVLEEATVLRVYPVAVGAPKNPTPAGIYEVVGRIPEPTWYGPHRIVPPGKGNPLGTRWIGLSRKGYGIHGTNNPRSIGRRASHGCVRMRNSDVEQLFDLVAVGDVVEFHDQPGPETDRIFGNVQLASQEHTDEQQRIWTTGDRPDGRRDIPRGFRAGAPLSAWRSAPDPRRSGPVKHVMMALREGAA